MKGFGRLHVTAVLLVSLSNCLSSAWGSRREGIKGLPMPPQLAGPGIGMGPVGGYNYPQQQYGQSYDHPDQYGQPQYGQPQGGGQYGMNQNPPANPPPFPPFGYKDPGFSVQTGFEGFLVPNSWYGLLPWGIEGVVIVIVGIIVAMVIVVSIVALLVWLTGFGDFAVVKEARSYKPDYSIFSMDTLNAITDQAYDAFEKYNVLVKAEDEKAL